MYNRLTTLKAVTKGIIDFCILPGTSGGAEILWLYSLQWKNRLSLIALAIVSVAFSHMHMIEPRTPAPTSVNEPGNTR